MKLIAKIFKKKALKRDGYPQGGNEATHLMNGMDAAIYDMSMRGSMF